MDQATRDQWLIFSKDTPPQLFVEIPSKEDPKKDYTLQAREVLIVATIPGSRILGWFDFSTLCQDFRWTVAEKPTQLHQIQENFLRTSLCFSRKR